MKWLWGAVEETLPVVLFFVVQQQTDFLTGVAVMLVATFILLVLAYLAGQALPKFAVVSTLGLTTFALPTLITGDSSYFQLSDTILDGVLAIALLLSAAYKRPLLKPLFEQIFAITDHAWQVLTIRWGLLFLLLAILNEAIRLTYDTEVWSLFKLISTIGIVVFGCYQFTLSRRYRLGGQSNALGLRTK